MFIRKALILLSAALFFACGAQSDETEYGNEADAPVDLSEESEYWAGSFLPDPDAEAADEAAESDDDVEKQIHSLFGIPPNPTLGPCTFPNTSSTACMIPTDRIVKYHWEGATTVGLFPGIDFKALMQRAIYENKLQFGLTNWTIVEGSSSSNELMSLNVNTCRGGTCNPAVTIQSGGSVFQNGTGRYFKKSNACTTRLNPEVMYSAWGTLPVDTQKAWIKRMMKHEMGHCYGFNDFATGAGTAMMYQFVQLNPPDFNAGENTALAAYDPSNP